MNQAALHRERAGRELTDPQNADRNLLFNLRLETNTGILQELFFTIYPEATHRAAFTELVELFPRLFNKRAPDLQIQDLQRLKEGNWYQSQHLAGMQLYVDHFNKDLKGLAEKLPYLEKLGINFLHLMPITTRPIGENDGGYAVNSYTQVDKRFGAKKDFLDLTGKLRSRKMYLMLDFVVNHTSNEFPWAKKAIRGDQKYQQYYYTYPDRTIPDAFETSLPEVFPQTAPGNFTYQQEMQKWVMTVFNEYQWDLNYTNPQVFMAMLENLMELVNMGVDMVRFDALAFLWKQIGTSSQNLPEAHTLIALFRMCLQVMAPGVILLAEAIVAPRDIVAYFGEGIRKGNECEVAYNASLMALLWNSIATTKTTLLYKTLENIPSKPAEATWVNYIRCHDDIGLGYEDRYIYEVGWDARAHRKFLLEYYGQQLDWSPATGYIFMYDPKTGDGRITGSAASLLGLEKALQSKEKARIQESVDKIILMHGIILSYGGIPMIYGGDELGSLNDYSYLGDPAKKDDSRWVNRPVHDWDVIASLDRKRNYQAKIFRTLQHLIQVRKNTPAFADQANFVLHHPGNPHVLVYERTGNTGDGVLVVCNFDRMRQVIQARWVAQLGYMKKNTLRDAVTDKRIALQSGLLELPPYGILWLVKR